MKINNKLNFTDHIDKICKKTIQKLNTLSRLIPYMDIAKQRMLLNMFFWSQFSYFPLVSMFYSLAKNNKINWLHQRCFQIMHSDKKSTFIELLKKIYLVSIHTRNFHFLGIEMFKFKRCLVPALIKEMIPQTKLKYKLSTSFKVMPISFYH